MPMRPLVAVLVVMALALAGCSKKSSDDDPEASSSMTSTGAAGNATANHAPTASLLANATDEDPLNVTFRMNATDADGDDLTWELDFGDEALANGTFGTVAGNGSVPQANVTHAYAAGGLYNATLRVSDGNATANVTLALNLTAGSSFPQFVASGTPDFPCVQCSDAGANTGVGYRAGVNELDSWFVEIPADAAGQPFTVSAAADVDMVFRDGCEGGAAVGDPFQADGDERGIVPEGALCMLSWLTDSPGETITLTIG